MKGKNCEYCGKWFDSTGNSKYCMECRAIARRVAQKDTLLNQYYGEWLDRAMAMEERITKLEESFEVIHKWSIDRFREKD